MATYELGEKAAKTIETLEKDMTLEEIVDACLSNPLCSKLLESTIKWAK